jgi:hypothetical protein
MSSSQTIVRTPHCVTRVEAGWNLAEPVIASPAELDRFEDLASMLPRVPKSEIDEKQKGA